MKDFFDALSEFLGSEFAKENEITLIVFVFTLIVLVSVVISIIFNKIVFPIKFNKLSNIEKDYKKVLDENERLKNELSSLKNIKKMIEAANSCNSDTEELSGWEKDFLSKKERLNTYEE